MSSLMSNRRSFLFHSSKDRCFVMSTLADLLIPDHPWLLVQYWDYPPVTDQLPPFDHDFHLFQWVAGYTSFLSWPVAFPTLPRTLGRAVHETLSSLFMKVTVCPVFTFTLAELSQTRWSTLFWVTSVWVTGRWLYPLCCIRLSVTLPSVVSVCVLLTKWLWLCWHPFSHPVQCLFLGCVQFCLHCVPHLAH